MWSRVKLPSSVLRQSQISPVQSVEVGLYLSGVWMECVPCLYSGLHTSSTKQLPNGTFGRTFCPINLLWKRHAEQILSGFSDAIARLRL